MAEDAGVNLHCVIPMAGKGQRFLEKGYTFPKYLTTIRGKPMIQWVIESLGLPDVSYHFGCLTQDVERYHLQHMFEQLVFSHVGMALLSIGVYYYGRLKQLARLWQIGWMALFSTYLTLAFYELLRRP